MSYAKPLATVSAFIPIAVTVGMTGIAMKQLKKIGKIPHYPKRTKRRLK